MLICVCVCILSFAFIHMQQISTCLCGFLKFFAPLGLHEYLFHLLTNLATLYLYFESLMSTHKCNKQTHIYIIACKGCFKLEKNVGTDFLKQFFCHAATSLIQIDCYKSINSLFNLFYTCKRMNMNFQLCNSTKKNLQSPFN